MISSFLHQWQRNKRWKNSDKNSRFHSPAACSSAISTSEHLPHLERTHNKHCVYLSEGWSCSEADHPRGSHASCCHGAQARGAGDGRLACSGVRQCPHSRQRLTHHLHSFNRLSVLPLTFLWDGEGQGPSFLCGHLQYDLRQSCPHTVKLGLRTLLLTMTLIF